MNKKVILSHAGKQHSYQVAYALEKLGYLESFFTSSYIRSRFAQQVINRTGSTYFNRRFLDGLYGSKIHPNWRFEFRELLTAAIYGKGIKTQEAVFQRDILFDRFISGKLQGLRGSIFWGFQGSCHDCLATATNIGKTAVVELSNAHISSARKILGEEKKLNPEWANSFDNFNFPPAYEKRLEEEPYLADFVIAASTFTKQTLLEAGVNEKKIYQLPLGADFGKIEPKDFNRLSKKGRPLRILFTGRITQRKGIKYLLEAVLAFSKKDVELHIIGFMHGDDSVLTPYKNRVHFHPSISQNELYCEYRNYDLLVLPSVFEGFGLVIVEAMAAGLPVIATTHTFGPDIILNDQNGFLISIRDSKAIINAVEAILGKSDEDYIRMCESARISANVYSWENYRIRLDRLITSMDVPQI